MQPFFLVLGLRRVTTLLAIHFVRAVVDASAPTCECAGVDPTRMNRPSTGHRVNGMGVLTAIVAAAVRAPELVGSSPSGVSGAIARLGERLDARPLNRSTRSMSLTGDASKGIKEIVGLDAVLTEGVAGCFASRR